MVKAVKKTDLVKDHINLLLRNNSFDRPSPPTAKDIAQELNLDRATVAKGLEPFIERNILKNVKRKGIVRVESSNGLQNSVGLVLCPSGDFYGELTQMIISELNKRGVSSFIIDREELKNGNPGAIQSFQEILLGNPKGLIIDFKDHYSEKHFDKLSLMPENLVFLVSYEAPGEMPGSGVFIDFESGIYQATEHLIKKGHRRIALATHRLPLKKVDPEQKKRIPYFQVIKGYESALKDYGIDIEPEIFWWARDDGVDPIEELKKLMACPEPPTALVCSNDYYAVSLMKELVRMGYKIPKDISITGFYDTPWCEVITPELTTTKIDIEQMAKLAVSEVLKESPGRTICKIQPKLVVRNSVCTL